MYVLGVSGNFGRAAVDASAVLLRDGQIVAAAEEERFVRTKHAPAQMAEESVRYVLEAGGITMADVDVLAFPQTTWGEMFAERLQEFCEYQFGAEPKQWQFVEHHVAHAASAYRYSGFDDAIVITADWSGDGVAATVCVGENGSLKVLDRWPAPLFSLGVYYAAMTQFLGFKKWEDEYKVMGLASYGDPDAYNLAWLLTDGEGREPWKMPPWALSSGLQEPYPSFHGLQEPSFSPHLNRMLGRWRVPGSPVTDRDKDLAASVQHRLEMVMEQLVRAMVAETGFRNVCIAGGVGLNCSANGAMLQLDCVDAIYVPPVPNDAGVALGAAAEVALAYGDTLAPLDHASWGPEFDDEAIESILLRSKVPYERVDDPPSYAAEQIANDRIVGWFQGRMEFGARALGNRSILADPRRADMRDRINYYVKFREDFRPLAPSILAEAAPNVFEGAQESPFMTITFDVVEQFRSQLPAITHVDGTARPQTVTESSNPLYRNLIEQVYQRTGAPVVLNTSLNVRGDPIAARPEQAIATFYSTGLDDMVIGPFALKKDL